MSARVSLLSVVCLGLLMVPVVLRCQASPHGPSPSKFLGAVSERWSAAENYDVTRPDYPGGRVGEKPGWSAVGYAAIIFSAQDSIKIEPVTVFVFGALLVLVATSLRLRVIKKIRKKERASIVSKCS